MIPSTEEVTIFGTALTVIIGFFYKFFRIVKGDQNVDVLDKEEKEFRDMLRVDIQALKIQNDQLLRERAELIAKIRELETRIEFLINNCDNCRFKNP